jgi:hypothetical protein
VSEALVLHALTTSDVRVAHESHNCRIASGSTPEELATKARAAPADHVSIASPRMQPSPNGRRVGIRIVTFEACSSAESNQLIEHLWVLEYCTCSGRRRTRDLRFLKPGSEVVFVGTIFVSLPEEPNNEVGHQPHDGGNDQHHHQLDHRCVPSKAYEVAYHIGKLMHLRLSAAEIKRGIPHVPAALATSLHQVAHAENGSMSVHGRAL